MNNIELLVDDNDPSRGPMQHSEFDPEKVEISGGVEGVGSILLNEFNECKELCTLFILTE